MTQPQPETTASGVTQAVSDYRQRTGETRLKETARKGLLGLEGASPLEIRLVLNTIGEEKCDSIVISNNQELTDDLLALFASVPGLEFVNFANTNIGDNGIERLVGHPTLNELQLSGTQVTDKVVDYLCQIPNLRKIALYDTAVTEEAVDRLRAILQERNPEAIVMAYFR